MRRVAPRALLLVALAASVACVSAPPVVRLRTAGAQPYWVAGHETVAQARNGLNVAAAFERGANGELALRVEVMNQSEERVDVDPRRFWFNHCRAPEASSCTPSVAVRDPERSLEGMDQEASNQRADAQNEVAAGLGLALLLAVVDVAATAKGDRHHDHSLGRDVVATSRYNAARDEAAARDLDAARESLAMVALRRTTLFPGHGVAGQVYVPVNFEAPYVRLNARVGNEVFVFLWRRETLDGRPTVPTVTEAEVRTVHRPHY